MIKPKSLVILSTVLICLSCATVVCGIVIMMITWRTYDPKDVMNSLTLRSRQEMTAFTYGIMALVLGTCGLLLRHRAISRTK